MAHYEKRLDISVLGDKADDILSCIVKNYNIVKTRFDEYFSVRKNVVYERGVFKKRVQIPNEPVDEFILSLHYLVEHCRFEALKEELIRDRLVVGLANVTLSERLQMDLNLTLQRAIESARNSELVKRQGVQSEAS